MIRAASFVCIVLMCVCFATAAFAVPTMLVDVKALGAVGDGKADDTEAFRQALAKAGRFVIIEVPEGTYRVGELALPSHTHLRGRGKAVIVGGPILIKGKMEAPRRTIVKSIGRGATVFTVSDAAGLAAGDYVVPRASLDEDNNDRKGRVNELRRVKTVEGNTVTLAEPAAHEYKANAKYKEQPHLVKVEQLVEGVRLEKLSFLDTTIDCALAKDLQITDCAWSASRPERALGGIQGNPDDGPCADVTLKDCSFTFGPAADDGANYIVGFFGLTRGSFTGLSFVGGRKCGLRLRAGVADATVENCTFDKVRGRNIWLYRSSGCVVRNVTMTDPGYKLEPRANVEFLQLDFTYNALAEKVTLTDVWTRDAIELRAWAEKVTVKDFKVSFKEDFNSFASAVNIHSNRHCKDIKVIGGEIHLNRAAASGIKVHEPVQGLVIENNTITAKDGVAVAAALTGVRMCIGDSADFVIRGNTIDRGTGGVVFGYRKPKEGDKPCVIRNLVFEGNTIRGSATAGSDLILSQVVGAVVRDNKFLSGGSRTVSMAHPTNARLTVIGNTFKGKGLVIYKPAAQKVEDNEGKVEYETAEK